MVEILEGRPALRRAIDDEDAKYFVRVGDLVDYLRRTPQLRRAQTTWCSQRTGTPSPACRKVSSSSSQGLPSSLSISSSQRGLAERGLDDGGLEPVLGDHDVAVQAGDGVEDAEVGRGGEAGALGARRCGSSVTSKRRWFQPRRAEVMAAAVPGSPVQENSAR